MEPQQNLASYFKEGQILPHAVRQSFFWVKGVRIGNGPSVSLPMGVSCKEMSAPSDSSTRTSSDEEGGRFCKRVEPTNDRKTNKQGQRCHLFIPFAVGCSGQVSAVLSKQRLDVVPKISPFQIRYMIALLPRQNTSIQRFHLLVTNLR